MDSKQTSPQPIETNNPIEDYGTAKDWEIKTVTDPCVGNLSTPVKNHEIKFLSSIF